MLVLGIHDGHNSGAALVKDGKVIAAISEERINNIKNFPGPPLGSISEVYKISGIDSSETDLITVGCKVRMGNPYPDGNIYAKFQIEMAPYLHSHLFSKLYVYLLHKFRKAEYLDGIFNNISKNQKPITDIPIIYIDHHKTHAACAYYQRPWKDDAIIFTLDGSGDGLSATVSIGKKLEIIKISETTFYDSLSNNIYSEITGFLGMKKWEHEYKIMGLAPYGKDDGLIEEFKKIIRINPDRPLEFENISNAYLNQITEKLKDKLTGKRFDNIAFSTQKYFEDLVVQWVKNAIRKTGIRNIVCSGGSFLNVKANKLIRELKEVDKSFFYPVADDGGTPVGAALEGYIRLCKSKNQEPKIIPLKDLYLGNEFSDNVIENVLKVSSLKKSKKYSKDELSKKAALLLSIGKIIARFSGRAEIGPRALGNRSILADPRNMNVIRKLNFAVKQRDFWMPFALSILEDEAGNFFNKSRPSPYMIEAFDTKPDTQNSIIAGLHPYDLTCRPQTVNNWNPSYRKIIEEFKKLTSVPAILNTSFNLHGFPIVGTPKLAIDTFKKSGIDALIIGNYIIEK